MTKDVRNNKELISVVEQFFAGKNRNKIVKFPFIVSATFYPLAHVII
jgi:hypothetical protein